MRLGLRRILGPRNGRKETPPSSGGDDDQEPAAAGAIPYAVVDGQIVFLMITSRGTGRWIFPKGGLIDGLSPAESAAVEAYEEAGVRGRVGTDPVGTYSARSRRLGNGGEDEVRMYPLEVENQYDDWPERRERKRSWVTLAEARRLLSEPELVSMAEDLAGRVAQ